MQIQHKVTDDVLFEGDYLSVMAAAEAAVREDVSLKNADLREADLEGANLRSANLEGANLRGARLIDADLEDAYLAEVDLRGAYLEGANLRGAYLINTDLEGAYLKGANLRGAYLRGACFGGTHLEGSNLEGARLKGDDLIDAGQDRRGFQFIGCRFANGVWVVVGCRWFSLSDARAHWGEGYPGDAASKAWAYTDTGDRVEINAKLDLIEATAQSRGWKQPEKEK
tara:strand:+ start:14325 stop:15002 length:678 start_codon:yes stop_codon:yes gene_type:complete